MVQVQHTDHLLSISQSYWDQGVWPRNIFVGFLMAIAALLLAYNGESATEKLLAKLASLAAFGVAMNPCECPIDGCPHPNTTGAHSGCAAVLFAILALFCWIFARRAWKKYQSRYNHLGKIRAICYAVFGSLMIVDIVFLAGANANEPWFAKKWETRVYWGEAAGLWSFGLSWLLASHTIPILQGREWTGPLKTAYEKIFAPAANGRP
jgi:hypothetical protein